MTRAIQQPFWPGWRNVERGLLAIFLTCQVIHFWRCYGVTIGFDWFAHLEMIEKASFSHPPNFRAFMYAYHPPLGFLMARVFRWLGFAPTPSAQIVSFCGSLMVFFFLRATLVTLGLLRRPAAILFLYLSSSIPLRVYLSTSVNLDVLILGGAAAALYLSVRLFAVTGGETSQNRRTIWLIAALVLTLAISLLIKFSALLLLAVPALVAVCLSSRRRIRSLLIAAAICVTACMLVFPYYYVRYYRTEGKFLVNNTDMWRAPEVAKARTMRDNDRAEFVRALLRKSDSQRSDVTAKDLKRVRLFDAWRDVWLLVNTVGKMKPPTRQIGSIYMSVAPWLILIGGICFLLQSRRRTSSVRIGWVIVLFSGLQVAALLAYCWSEPYAEWGPSKGIYATPATWGIGLFVSLALCALLRLMPVAIWRWAITLFTVAFVIANHLVPVY